MPIAKLQCFIGKDEERLDGYLGLSGNLCTDYMHRLMKIVCQIIIIIVAKYQIWDFKNLSKMNSDLKSLNYCF